MYSFREISQFRTLRQCPLMVRRRVYMRQATGLASRRKRARARKKQIKRVQAAMRAAAVVALVALVPWVTALVCCLHLHKKSWPHTPRADTAVPVSYRRGTLQNKVCIALIILR